MALALLWLDTCKCLRSTTAPTAQPPFSRPVVTHLLRKEIGFEGLIFTDAMEMEGVKKFFPNGSADVGSLKAGNDVILLPVDLGAAWAAIKVALGNGSLELAELCCSA